MYKSNSFITVILLVAAAAILFGAGPGWAVTPMPNPGGTPDYFNTPNWANSPVLRKFVDTLPGLGAANANNLGQYIPIANPDTTTYRGADYYEIGLKEYSVQMHSDMGVTKLRGYYQINNGTVGATDHANHYLGPLIIATKGKPVRIKFVNELGTGAAGNLFIPVDTTIMGSGPFEIDYNPEARPLVEIAGPTVTGNFTQNRATLHLHGGRSPWISDGTPHQWITPAGETTSYPKGVSVGYVPDMWFDASGNTIAGCAGSTTCGTDGATNNPGAGAQTFYWTNAQSARLMFYHDHAWGITRLNVYAGEAAGYLIQDPTEQALVAAGTIPSEQIPLIIQDKTFVDETTIGSTDPTWNWGTVPGSAVTGDLWWPHVYMPAQNPYAADGSGVNAYGRWHYGPWFWPPTNNVPYGPVANPLYNPDCIPSVEGFCQPPMMPGTPNPSWGAEAFMDTPVINGTAYPKLTVQPRAYRFRVLNAAHDRFFNLQFYVADSTVPVPTNCTGTGCVANTEVKMVPAIPRSLCSAIITTDCVCDGAFTPVGCFPPAWPTDSRPGGVPDPATAGPSWIQIGTEGGFLPQPVVLPNQPVNWNTDVTTFNAGNVLNWADGGGSLMLGTAERADVIVDFSQFAGQTLILYNDAPAPWPALDPHYDYYTGVEDLTSMGGSAGTLVGRGPNTRTLMQIQVAAGAGTPFNLANLQAAFVSTSTYDGVFKQGQENVIVGQSAYDSTYNTTFPAIYPNWGLSRITDTSISFKTPDGTVVSSYPIKAKAIQDEMGETFDDYGRMSAKLGLELPATTALNQTFVVQNYVDPPTEILTNGEVQIWKITHNGVDTHPIHFHLFEVQLLNRVGWDGFIRLPDANELGWKDTVRISPLEDTIVAVRAVVPTIPFTLPESVRPMNPEQPIGSTVGFTNLDPLTAQPIVPAVTNQLYNFGWEYVWHCHILSHEENDMMRSIVLQRPTAVPANPTLLTAALVPPVTGNAVQLDWTDNSNVSPNSETGFRVERCAGAECSNFAAIMTVFPNVTTYTDGTVLANTTYRYRVFAFNTAGDSASPTNTVSVTTAAWVPATRVTITHSSPCPPVPVTFTFAGQGSTTPYQYRVWLDGVMVRDYSTGSTLTLPASTAPGTYTIAVDVRTNGASTTADASNSLIYAVSSSIPVADFSGTPLSGVAPLTVNFTDLSTSCASSWLWAFGDGVNSISRNPSHSYNPVWGSSFSVSYNVALTATNANGSNTLTMTSYVTAQCPISPAKNSRTGTTYTSLQAAYDAASAGDTILSHALTFTEDLTISKAITFDGGYNCDYASHIGRTTLAGNLTVGAGVFTVNMDNLNMQ